MHFSGWDINNPSQISKFAPMYEQETYPFWIELSEVYRDRLLKSGYEESISYPYAFKYFITGDLITSAMRRIYYNDLMQGTTFESSPFLNYPYFDSKCYHDKPRTQSFLQRLKGRASRSFTKLLP